MQPQIESRLSSFLGISTLEGLRVYEVHKDHPNPGTKDHKITFVLCQSEQLSR